MFNHVGAKIKLTFKIFFWLILVGGEIGGIGVLIESGGDVPEIYVPILAFSPLAAWLICCIPYAFGDIADTNEKILELMSKGVVTTATPMTSTTSNVSNNKASLIKPEVNINSKKAKLDQMLAENLITKEEYDKLISQ